MAVKYYSKARKTLDHYKQMPTFRSIEDDCTTIIKNLKVKLYARLDANESSSEIIAESVNLLNQVCTVYNPGVEFWRKIALEAVN